MRWVVVRVCVGVRVRLDCGRFPLSPPACDGSTSTSTSTRTSTTTSTSSSTSRELVVVLALLLVLVLPACDGGTASRKILN